MSSLGQIIRAIQHDAAALPTGELRDEIEVSLGVLDATISQFHRVRPGIRGVDERIIATGDVDDIRGAISDDLFEPTTPSCNRCDQERAGLGTDRASILKRHGRRHENLASPF